MRRYAPDLAGGADSAPTELLTGFLGEKKRVKGGKGGKEKGEGKRNGNEKEVKGEMRGGKEKDKGKGGRKGNGRGKGEKGRNFVQLWFFLRKNPATSFIMPPP